MTRGSVYMRWAKEHAAARYNLANSGLLGCSTADLVLEPGDVQVNAATRDGYPPLLEAIAAQYGVSPGQVVTAPGTSGANFLAFAALVDPGDEVLVERPTYEPILAALGFLGAQIRRFERRFENGYHLDLDEVRSLLTDRTRLLVLADPHNPSGVMLEPEEVAGLARLAEGAGAHLLVDEVYRDIWFEAAPPSHVHLGPNVLATSSLTKSYGLSGLRCGWILCAPDVARRLWLTRDAMQAVDSVPPRLPGGPRGVARLRHPRALDDGLPPPPQGRGRQASPRLAACPRDLDRAGAIFRSSPPLPAGLRRDAGGRGAGAGAAVGRVTAGWVEPPGAPEAFQRPALRSLTLGPSPLRGEGGPT
ncbi:MAG: hypothetical protein DMF53_12475 [Acidobacteria bacterium]|nr:MAG: hypothetical protein DMF53_12475 [Acidobacteriota bacterium]